MSSSIMELIPPTGLLCAKCGSNNVSAPTDSSPSPVSAANLDQVSEISNAILEIVYQYTLSKFDNTAAKHAAGHPKFMAVVSAFVSQQKPVLMALPAFPFKSANKAYKVFGILPDKAEEISLGRLNDMCKRIAQIYEPGAQLTIISDGLVYNDLLCIPDRDVWAYGQALRAMAVEKGFTHLSFSRLRDLTEIPLPEKLEEIVYVANATNFRRHLLNRWGKDDINVDHEIANNPDTLMTYRGYGRFLESDLQYVFPHVRSEGRSSTMSGKAFKRNIKFLAKQMIFRGYAFAGACKNSFPNHLRLSIHQSTGEHKISMSLLDTKTGYTTPWHCEVALMADGDWLSAPMGDFKENPNMEVVYENGRPSYFRETLPPTPPAEETADAFVIVDNESLPVSGAVTPSTSSDSVSDPLDSPSGILSYNNSSSQSVTSQSASEEDATPESLKDLAAETTPTIKPTSEASASNKPERITTASNQYGNRLIPHILDELALTDPSRTVYSIAKSSDISQGLQSISAYAMSQAVNKTAWWLHSHLPSELSSTPQTVGYIGPHDLRYVLLTYACIKAGHQVLFLSPKNSIEGATAVLKAAQCAFWAQPAEQPLSHLIEACLERQAQMSVLSLPTVDELLSDADSVAHFPYDKTWEQAADETFCMLHTSGSTGLPKPIRWSHALIGTMDAVRLLPPVEGDMGLAPWTALFEEGDRIYSSFPMSHGAGTIMDVMVPSYFGMECVLGPAGVIPNMELTGSLAEFGGIDVWSMVPTLVDELGETPDVLERLGGDAGKVNEVVRVLNLTGTTEGLFIGNLVVEREDWRYFAFHPYSGFEFRQVRDPNEYEHWCVRNQHGPLFQGIFHTFPEKTEVNLKDLYVKHPTKPGYWAFNGRSDDVVVLSNGYKIAPLETEALMTSHPAIDGCLVVGSAQPQAGLLIELKDPATMIPVSQEILDSIWELVQKANEKSMHKDQLRKDYIMFAEADKPFVRTDKRTVKRKDTLALYADYIERFYQTADPELALSVAVDSSSAESITGAVHEILASIMVSPTLTEVPVDVDLFHLGLDSLRVFQVIRSLQVAIPELQDILAPRHLYANPTVSKFATVVAKLVQGALTGSGDVEEKEKVAKMKELLNKYKTRSSLKMTGFDQMLPHLHVKMLLYLPLRQGVSFEHAFAQLQGGLARTISLLPTLDYMVTDTPENAGCKPGQVEIVPPPPSNLSTDGHPRQLIFRDLSKELPSFAEMRSVDFVHPAVTEEALCDATFYPRLPTDIFRAEANFVDGGCLLVMCVHHCVLDSNGMVTVLRAWSESCRFLQGDTSATCAWLDPESMNRSLLQAIFEAEGHAASRDPSGSDIPPSVWNHIGFPPPTTAAAIDTTHAFTPTPLAPALRPPPQPSTRHLTTTIFHLPSSSIAQLQAEVAADPSITSPSPSLSDIIQALFWRATIRARAAVTTNPPPPASTTKSIIEIAVDGRPYFSTLLPSSYMGNLMLFNRIPLTLDELTTTRSIGQVAALIRDSASLINTKLFHDAHGLVEAQVGDYRELKYSFMRRAGFDLAMTNVMLFEIGEVLAFGRAVFGNEDIDDGDNEDGSKEVWASPRGGPVAMRMLHGVQNSAHRLDIVLPRRRDGGVEVLLGTFPEELEEMLGDGEWMRYARLM